MTTWSTEVLRPHRRFEYWVDVVCKTFVRLDCLSPVRESFGGSIRSRGVGPVTLALVEASPQRVTRTWEHVATDPSEQVIVALQMTGVGAAEQAGATVELPSGHAAVVDADAPYAFAFHRNFQQLVLKMPRANLTALHGGDNGSKPRRLRLDAGAGRLLKQIAMAALLDEELSEEECCGVGEAIADLTVGALAAARGDRIPPSRIDESRWRAALDFIDVHLPEPRLSRSGVASALGMSVRAVTRLFASRGTTVDGVIWARRLDACRAELASDPVTTATDIAFKWGFSDSAHFSRRFAGRFGMTPTEFRRLLGRREA